MTGRGGLLAVIMLLLLGCTITYTPKMFQHFEGSVFQASDSGYYTLELVMKPERPVVGKNSADLIIHDYRADDIPCLKITATLFPAAGSELSGEKVKVTDDGCGLYVLENIDLREPGLWKMEVEIDGQYKDDTAVLTLPEVR